MKKNDDDQNVYLHCWAVLRFCSFPQTVTYQDEAEAKPGLKDSFDKREKD